MGHPQYSLVAATLAAAVLSVAGADAAQGPVPAVLTVQNHASGDFGDALLDVGDRISAALSGGIFKIIDPGDAIGTNQNRGPQAEEMPGSSATRLAENLGARALITASIGEVSTVGFGTPARVQALRMTITISAKELPGGAEMAAATVSEMSPKMLPAALEQNADAVCSELLGRLVEKASARFLAKSASLDWGRPAAALAEVGFGCNFPGADVAIDGISFGTAGTIGQPPLKVNIQGGIHNLRISCPCAEPYEVRANLQDGAMFMVILKESDEGRRIRREDRHFDALMDRIAKSGATDDEVRLLRARGYGAYLAGSHTRLEGIPEILSMRDCEPPALGLEPGDSSGESEATTGELIDAAVELIEGGSGGGKGDSAEKGGAKKKGKDAASEKNGKKGSARNSGSDGKTSGAAEPESEKAAADRRTAAFPEPPDNTDFTAIAPMALLNRLEPSNE